MKIAMKRLSLVLGFASALVGCGSSDDTSTTGSGGSGGGSQLVGAAGVTITRVDVLQGPRRTVWENGQNTGGVPIVAGRPALVRVYFATDASYDGGPVTARLTPAVGDAQDITAGAGLGGFAPVEEDASTTFNFDLTGDQVGETFAFNVVLGQDHGSQNPAAVLAYSAPVESQRRTLRVKIVPFAYNNDGSGRLPDTSAEVVENFRRTFMAMYPVSNVEITVHDPVAYSGKISSDGNDWQGVGFQLSNLRGNEVGSNSDVYYYGMFNPAASFFSYCGSGCVLGLTLANNDPPDTGNGFLRLALGVGYPAIKGTGFTYDGPHLTAAHEIGHAHGRLHAPCAPGNQITGIDSGYPYQGAKLGVWGWHLEDKELLDPSTHTDIMGYCAKQFVSDYQYSKLDARIQRVSTPALLGTLDYDVIGIDGAGHLTWGGEYKSAEVLTGRVVQVEATSDEGEVRHVEGQYFAYDHIGGGWLLVPKAARQVHVRATFMLDGATLDARR